MRSTFPLPPLPHKGFPHHSDPISSAPKPRIPRREFSVTSLSVRDGRGTPSMLAELLTRLIGPCHVAKLYPSTEQTNEKLCSDSRRLRDPAPLRWMVVRHAGACGRARAGRRPLPLRLRELEAFRPCGRDEEWWVTWADELRARAEAIPEGGSVYAVVRAHVSPEGSFGHLGAFRRQLSVVEVLEVRASSSRDCR